MLQSILNSFDCCVLAVDGTGNLVEVDDAACTLLGYLPDEVIGQPASLLLELAEPGAGPRASRNACSRESGRFP